jgi:hypothetical protein
MALSKAAEDAFHSAIEAAYAMQELGVKAEDKRLAEQAYVYWMEEYYLLSKSHHRDQWWEAMCKADPSAARCRLYDV